MKLYEVAEAFAQIQDFLNNAETDDEIVAIKEVLVDYECQFEEKVENIVYLLKNFEADIDVLKAEEKRLNDKRKSLERKTESLKDYLFGAFMQTGTERIKYPQFTVAIRNNAESVNVKDVTKIPNDYFVPQPPKLNKAGLKKAIQSGVEIDGVELVRNKSLQIR